MADACAFCVELARWKVSQFNHLEVYVMGGKYGVKVGLRGICDVLEWFSNLDTYPKKRLDY